MRADARLAAALLLCGLLPASAGCGPSEASRRAELLAAGQSKLADDPSAALELATRGRTELGED
ncbi:MAG TPA: hypothetical protein VFD43_13850, partial [Planctomycetota bacterium]|nr:hypothetical protein [Planctomycetota bacterium]